MEPCRPMVLQGGNKVVKHGYLKVLTINPSREYKYTSFFPHDLNSFHTS